MCFFFYGRLTVFDVGSEDFLTLHKVLFDIYWPITFFHKGSYNSTTGPKLEKMAEVITGLISMFNNGTPWAPYYSHTTPIRIPKDMDMVWE